MDHPPYETDWEALKVKQQNKINKSNIRENLKRYKYDYEIGDKVIIKRDINDDIIRCMEYVNEGPYTIQKVYYYSKGVYSLGST